MQTSRLWGTNFWPKFEILTVLGAVFPHFRPDKREIWHGGADPDPNFTFIGATCRPCGAKNPFLDHSVKQYRHGCATRRPAGNNANVHGAVIMVEPLQEFTRFIWWMLNGAKRPTILRPSQTSWAGSPPAHAARVYPHHRHLLLLLSPKADTVPRRVESWVDLVGWLHTEMVYPPTDGHPSWY